MPTRITEFHGVSPRFEASLENAKRNYCPFVKNSCTKTQSGGACSLSNIGGDPVIICPKRLYTENFKVLEEISAECFGGKVELVDPGTAEQRRRTASWTGHEVVVWGEYFGGEVGIPSPEDENGRSGSFRVDFLLARLDKDFQVCEIVAVEVQTIDTTDSYKKVAEKYKLNAIFEKDEDHNTKAGFNWENVSKRILPQIIYKGHALRRERLAQNGLFFVLPHQVFEKIKTRVGSRLLEYPKGPGTVTFKSFVLSDEKLDGTRDVLPKETLTTTVEQIAFAFVSPQNLPDLGVYEATLADRLAKLSRKRNL